MQSETRQRRNRVATTTATVLDLVAAMTPCLLLLALIDYTLWYWWIV